MRSSLLRVEGWRDRRSEYGYSASSVRPSIVAYDNNSIIIIMEASA